MKLSRTLRFAAHLLLLLVFTIALHAATTTTQYVVLFDVDNSTASGCSYVAGSTTVSGIEQVLTTTVTGDGTTAAVTKVERQQCSGGVFTTPPFVVNATGWPAVIGPDGSTHVETHMPYPAFGSSVPMFMRLYFFVVESSTSSTAVTQNPEGDPITYPQPGPRHRAVSPTGLPVVPTPYTPDGNFHLFDGFPPLPTGLPATSGSPLLRFDNVFVIATSDDLLFLINTGTGSSHGGVTAVDDSYTVRQGHGIGAGAPGVLANDLNTTGSPMFAQLMQSTHLGTLHLNADGSFSYQNGGAPQTTDTFTYKATAGGSTSDAATVTFHILPDNVPIAVADAYSVAHAGTLNIAPPGVLTNDTDADHDALSAVIDTPPAHASAFTLNSNGSFTYTHDGTNTLSDTFKYRATDNIIPSAPATVTITVGPDAPPVAVADSYTVAEGGTLSVPAPGIFANDSDPDTPQAQWIVNVVTQPAHGNLVMGAGGAFTYVHDGSETIADSFTYNISDGIATSATVTVSITVTPVNDAPVAVADAYSTLIEDTPFSVNAASGVLANDTDADTPHASLTAVLVTGPAHAASFTLNPDGSFNYTPAANYNGADSFTYKANDGSLDSNIVTVTLTITAVNDVPTYTAGSNVSVNEDSGAYSAAWATSVSPGPADESGQALNFIISNDNNALFSAQPALSAGGVLTFTPAANANGTATVSIQLHDNGGTANGGVDTSTLATFTITVVAVDDAPVNTVPGAQSIAEDSTFTFTGANAITVNDIDVLAGNLTVTLSVANGTVTLGSTAGLTVTGNGTASVQATGTVAALNTGLNNTVYAPTANFNGSDTLTVLTSDNGNTGLGGPLTDTDTVAFTITGANDAPVISRPATATTNEDSPFTFNGGNVISIADVDAAGGSETVTLTVTNGTLTLAATTGLSFTVGDGTSDATMTFSGTLTNVNAALNGLLYAPNADYNGADTLSIGVNDNGNSGSGGPLTDSKSVAITVVPVNDPPVAAADGYSTNEDTALVVNAASGVLANDTDIDTAHASLTAVLNVGPTNASAFTLNADGSFSYTPNANFSGSDSFTYHANDGALDSNIVTVTITVTAVNDAPVITRPASVSTNEDTPTTFAGTISIADVDAASGNLSLTLSVANGTLTLSGTTGLTVSGNGTSSISATGTLANLNAALNGMSYTPSLNFNGGDTLSIGINDNGNTGSGGALTDSQSTSITVNAVNDPPVNSVPGTQSIAEDATLTFTGGTAITVSDVDAGGGNLQVTLSSANGTITLGGTVGLTVTGNGTSSVQATGTIAALNTGLAGTVFTPTADFNGSTSVSVVTSDLGNTGAGGALTDTDSITINISAVNDAPVITRPATVTTNEDTPVTFTAGNVISIADVDAASGTLTVTLGVSNGTLTLNGTTGLTVSGNGTNSITAAGNLTNLNAALNGLVYASTLNYNGADTLNIGVNDGGNTGSGGALTDSKSVAITINAVNDAPVATADAYSVNEDNTLTVNAASGVLANDTDVDTAHASLTAVLNVGPANASSFTLNADGSFSYTPNTNFFGSDSFTYHANDGALDSNIVTVTITINSINDAPVITRPATVAPVEDTAFTFNGGNTISVADVDAGAGSETVSLSVTSGTLTLSGTTGLSFTVGDGTADSSMTFSGTLTDINAALNGLQYLGNSNFNGADTLNIGVNDGGNSGAGGAATDSKSVTLNVSAVNDAPVNSVPGTQTINEDNQLTFTGATAISVSDVDAGGADVSVTLSSANGTITLGSVAGLTTVTGNGTSSVTATGPISVLNTDLNNTVFTPTADFNGATSVTVLTNDNGNTGSPGALTDTDVITINVTAINDAPAITRPATVSTNEDTTFTFNGGNVVSIADVDANGGSETVTLSVTQGTLTLAGTTGLSFSVGDGTSDAAMTFSGTLANINNALNGMTYLPGANYNGADTLSIGVNDGGNSGSGGALTDAKSVAITVNAVNDAPVATADAYSTNEDTALVVNAASGVLANDTDIDTPHASLTAILVGAPSNAASFTLNADGSFSYTPNANFNGSDSFTYKANDGALDSNTVTVTITINAVNDPPVITRPATASTNEDTTFTFNGGNTISIADVDAAGGSETVTLSVTQGTLTLSGITGLSFSVGDGTADSAMTFSGTLTNINNALNGMTYLPGANYNGADTLSIGVNDGGNSGTGGALTDAKSVAITVNAVNDAPVATADAYSTDEDTALVVNAASGVLANDTDIDTPHASLTAILVGAPSNAASFTLNADGSFSYTPNANFNGSDSFTYKANDGALDSNTVTVTITINAVNDPPVITRPATASTNEDTTFTFNGGNTISIADVDAAGGSETVTLSVTQGTLTLSGITGLSFSVGDGTADSAMTFSGTLTNINNALAGMTYLPGANYNGADTLSIGVNDGGNSGTGGALTDAKSVAITVNAVNDAPVATADSYSTNEDTALVVNAASGVLANDTDVDTPHASLTAILVSGPASASSFTLNADGSFSYTPNANFNGSDSFTYKANDGALNSNTVTVTITINAVNDPPVNSMPAPPSFPQDSTLTMSGAGAIQISDLDAGTNAVQVSLTSTNGTMSLNGTAGLSFTVGDGTSDASMTFTGTITAINTALNGMTFVPTPTYFGPASIQIVTNDLGFTGGGGAQSDTDTLNITVQQNDQPPVNTVPGAQSVNEDTALTFSSGGGNAISISDPDSTGPVKVTIGVLNGKLTLSGITGLSFTTGDGTADASMVFTGSIANINAALNGMTYLGNLNYNGSDTLTITTNDQESVIPGGPLSDTDTVSITVNSVDDAPVAVADSGYTVFKYTASSNTSLSVSAASGVLANDTDVDTAHASLTAILVTGPLHSQSFTLNADGSFTYVPTTGYVGADSFSYKANDGTLDSNTVTASITVLNHAPSGGPDSFTGAGNTSLEVGVTTFSTPRVHLSGNLLTNDSDADGDPISAVNETVTSTSGPSNNVTINADGTFTFTPAANVTSDTFTYHVTDGTDTTPVTVTITLTNKVWYVKNNVAGAGTGTSTDPFKTLASAATASAANEFIYVFFGDSTSANMNAGITLKANQSLIGENSDLVVGANTLATATANKPVITNATANSDAVTLAAGNVVKGLQISSATRDGIAGSAIAGFTGDKLAILGNAANGLHLVSVTGTVAVTNSSLSAAAGNALNIDNGTATVSIDATNSIGSSGTGRSVSIANRPAGANGITINAPVTDNGAGISLTANLAGTVTFGGAVSLTTTSNQAVTMTNNTAANFNFSSTLAITTTTGNGVVGSNAAASAGTLTINSATLSTGAAATGFSLTNVTVSAITFTNFTTTATTGLNLTTTGGTFTINAGSISGATTGISGSSFGTLAATLSTLNASGAIVNLATGTFNATITTLSGTNSGATVPITLNGVGGTITVNGGTVTKNTTAANMFNLTGGSATINWNGTLTQSTTGALFNVAATNTGTVTFATGTLSAAAGGQGLIFAGANGTYNFNGTTTLTGTQNAIVIGTSTGNFNFGAGVNVNNTTGTAIQINGTQPVVLFSNSITQTTNQKILVVTGVTGGSTVGIAAPYSIRFVGSITKSTNAATGIDINANSGGSIGFEAAVSLTTQTATALSIANNTGGAVKFVAGPTINTTSGAGVSAPSNGGMTLNFTSGALSITTTGGAGFSATGGGTVNITGATNTISSPGGAGFTYANCSSASTVVWSTISSTTAQAVNVSNSGATNFTFTTVTTTTGQAVGVTTATGTFTFNAINASGGSTPVVVNAACTFIVNGTGGSGLCDSTHTGGTDCQGGTITGATGTGMKFVGVSAASPVTVTLNKMRVFNNASSAAANCATNLISSDNSGCFANLYLQNASNVNLDRVLITGSKQQGINGLTIAGFSLTNSDVKSNGTGGFSADSGVTIQNLSGTVTVNSDNFIDNSARQFYVANIGAQSMTFNTTSSSFSRTVDGGAATGHGLLFDLYGSSSTTFTGNSLTFSHNQGLTQANALVFNFGSGSSASMSSSTISNSNFDLQAGGIVVAHGSTGTVRIDALSNTITHSSVEGIVYGMLGGGAGFTGTLNGLIQGNTIGTAANHGCNVDATNCHGIDLNTGSDWHGQMHVRVDNNTIAYVAQGIILTADGTPSGTVPRIDARLTRNNISNSSLTSAGEAIRMNAATTSTNFSLTLCYDIGGASLQNVISGDWSTGSSQSSLFLRNRFTGNSSVLLPGYAGSAASDANVQTYLAGRNSITVGPSAGQTDVTVSHTAGQQPFIAGTCTTP